MLANANVSYMSNILMLVISNTFMYRSVHKTINGLLFFYFETINTLFCVAIHTNIIANRNLKYNRSVIHLMSSSWYFDIQEIYTKYHF